MELLGRDGPDRARYERAVEGNEAAWPLLAAALPNQVIHSDYDRTNVLLADGAVSGVLDFEFSGPDLRAMDLAIGIYHFCLRGRIGRDEAALAALVHAFADGFSEKLALSKKEFEALPVLLLRRQLVACLHWLGRWGVGLSPSEWAAKERLARLSELQQWLDGDGKGVLAELADPLEE
jgi:homoserine kinase type II